MGAPVSFRSGMSLSMNGSTSARPRLLTWSSTQMCAFVAYAYTIPAGYFAVAWFCGFVSEWFCADTEDTSVHLDRIRRKTCC